MKYVAYLLIVAEIVLIVWILAARPFEGWLACDLGPAPTPAQVLPYQILNG